MSGSFVVSGECCARLEKVGADSYISQLTLEAKAMNRKEQSEMIRVLDKLVGVVGILIIPLGLLLFGQQFFVSKASFSSSIVSMVAAVIGMIPEGLYLLASVALAISVIRLSSQKVLVHDMKCIETLARVDVLCVDKPWFSVLTKLTYSAYLNILWLICSLPIFTIGASTTALFYCTLKMAEDRDEGLTRMFFRAFRSNFKSATKLWLILLALGCFLGVDGFVLSRLWNTSAFWAILTALVIGAAVLYAIVLLYAFPLLARFENTTLGILRTSFAVGVRYLFCTLLMAFIYAVMGWITVCVFAPAFLLGMGLCAMLCSFLLVKIIHLIGGDPDAADEESHNEER